VAAYKAGDLDKAIELLETGPAWTARLPLALPLGLLYGKRGQVYDAIEQLERALEIQSKHFASIKNLAILYHRPVSGTGGRRLAARAYSRAGR